MKILMAALLLTSVVSSVAQAAPAKAEDVVLECGAILPKGDIAGKFFIVTIDGKKGFVRRKFGMGVGPSAKPKDPRGEEYAASIVKMDKTSGLPRNPNMKPGLVDGYKLENYQDREVTLRVALKKEISGKYKGKQLGFKTYRNTDGEVAKEGMYCE